MNRFVELKKVASGRSGCHLPGGMQGGEWRGPGWYRKGGGLLWHWYGEDRLACGPRHSKRTCKYRAEIDDDHVCAGCRKAKGV